MTVNLYLRVGELPSSEPIHSEQWKFLTDVSEQPVGSHNDGLRFLTLQARTDMFRPEASVRNCHCSLCIGSEEGSGNYLPTFRNNLLGPIMTG